MARYIALWVFAMAFGTIEAIVVVYLRQIFDLGSDSLFPLSTIFDEANGRLLSLEANREIATLILMLVPAYLVSSRSSQRILAYVLVFAIWDLSYYMVLWLQLGWPASLLTYDVLFLVPTVWVAPVVVPLTLSCTMGAWATVVLYVSRNRSMRAPSLGHWIFLVGGVGSMLYAFMAESEYYLAGGLPPRYPWTPFLVGFALVGIASAHFAYRLARTAKKRFH